MHYTCIVCVIAMPRDDEIEKWLDSIGNRACFRERLKVYAPVNCGGENKTCRCGTRRARSKQNCEEAVEQLVVAINRLFGGSTVYDAKGSWLDEHGQLVIEPVRVIEAGHRCVAGDVAERFARAISEFADNSQQDAVAISQGNFYPSGQAKDCRCLQGEVHTTEKIGVWLN